MDSELETFLAREGYQSLVELNGRACGLRQFMFTWGLVYGLTRYGYQGRYCYERRDDAEKALAEWDGTGDPTGPWIKHKGHGIDILNPNLRNQFLDAP